MAVLLREASCGSRVVDVYSVRCQGEIRFLGARREHTSEPTQPPEQCSREECQHLELNWLIRQRVLDISRRTPGNEGQQRGVPPRPAPDQ